MIIGPIKKRHVEFVDVGAMHALAHYQPHRLAPIPHQTSA
jgi:hypothetical protein